MNLDSELNYLSHSRNSLYLC